MAVYNGELYLREAVESILNQTFSNFEFIIIDDASMDNTGQIVAEYAAQDTRLKLRRNQENIGLTRSLNRGLELASGRYIARMDADDISLPERLARQVDFLETYPQVGLLGTGVQMIDNCGNIQPRNRHLPGEHGILKWRLCFDVPFVHPAVMMRRKVVVEANGYDAEMVTSEDYDLWCRLSKLTRLANLPEVLVYWRWHDNRVSNQRAKQIYWSNVKISQQMMAELLGEEVSPDLVKHFWGTKFGSVGDDLGQVAGLIYQLYQASVSDPALSNLEKQLIRRSAAKNLYGLFRSQISDPAAWKILGLVCRLDPGLVIKKAGHILHKRVAWP